MTFLIWEIFFSCKCKRLHFAIAKVLSLFAIKIIITLQLSCLPH